MFDLIKLDLIKKNYTTEFLSKKFFGKNIISKQFSLSSFIVNFVNKKDYQLQKILRNK